MPNKNLGIADPGYDALRIYSGQSIAPDLGGGTTGGSGLENRIYVWHADGSTIDVFDPDEAGLNAALTAAASGDTVWIPSLTIPILSAITIAAGVTLCGLSLESTITGSVVNNGTLQQLLIIGDVSTTGDMNHVRVYNTSPTTHGISVTGSGQPHVFHCRVNLLNAPASTYGIYSIAPDARLQWTEANCFSSGDNSTDRAGGYIDAVSPPDALTRPVVFSCRFGGDVGAFIQDTPFVSNCQFEADSTDSGTAGLIHSSGTGYIANSYAKSNQAGVSIKSTGGTLTLSHTAVPDGTSGSIVVGGEGSMWFNVRDYGALGDGAANDTTAVQAALDAATVGGGVVYFPPGTYLCDPLTTYKNVTMLGDNQAASTIQANSSGSLITFLATAFPLVYSGGFRDLTLDGDSTGTNGLDIGGATTFKWERITVKNFTGIGIKLRAALIGEISDSYILGNATGIDIDRAPAGGLLNLTQSNLLEIVNTRFDTNSGWAIYSADSALLTIEHCDFEGNGTNANASTGSVYYAPASDGIGIRIANSWFEQTLGNAAIQIGTPTSAGALSVIENTLFSANQNATYGVYVNGTVRANNAICNAVKFDFDAAGGDFYADGASATITRYSCTGTTGGAGTIASYPPFGGAGTVTSVAAGTGLSASPSPITGSGTISLNAALNDLTDVDTTGEATGNVIYDNAGTWQVYPLGLGINITVNANKIRFGNFPGSNYLEIDTSSGNLRLVGDATAWDDMRITADVVKAGATAPNYKAFGPSGNLKALMFEAGHHDEATFSVQLPHQWKEGSRIYPHVHWTPTTADAGNVVWELEYAWTNIDGTFGAPSNMATDATAAGGTAWVHKLTQLKESGNNYIDGAGKTMSSMLVCRIHRNSNSGSDTLNQDVALLEVDFHFEIDSFGSDIADVKDASSALFLESGDYLLLESGDNLLLE